MPTRSGVALLHRLRVDDGLVDHIGKDASPPSMDEVWAYRARAIDELVPVRVLKFGTKSPPRVLVRFEEPAMEGREDWVPPTRLKVVWSRGRRLPGRGGRWAAVAALSPYQESPEVRAAEQASELLVDDAIAGFGYKDAHLVVNDAAAVAALAGLEEGFVTSHPAGFAVEDDGPLIVPWPVAVEIIKNSVRRNPTWSSPKSPRARRELAMRRSTATTSPPVVVTAPGLLHLTGPVRRAGQRALRTRTRVVATVGRRAPRQSAGTSSWSCARRSRGSEP